VVDFIVVTWRSRSLWILAAVAVIFFSTESCLLSRQRYETFITRTPLEADRCLVLGFLGGREKWNSEASFVRKVAIRAHKCVDGSKALARYVLGDCSRQACGQCEKPQRTRMPHYSSHQHSSISSSIVYTVAFTRQPSGPSVRERRFWETGRIRSKLSMCSATLLDNRRRA
jgi:hypothetical protein